LVKEAPAPIQRIGLAAPVAQGLVLHPPAALVELGVGQLHQVERIGDLDRVGHHGGERPCGGARQIQGGVADLLPPLLSLFLQPRRGVCTTATRNDVEELAPGDVDDLGGELLAVKGAVPGEEDFVGPRAPTMPEPLGVIVHQCGALAMTASLTVCQSQPSSRARSLTLRA